jgi:TM2 domain-containing membrane protein YozV
VKRNPVLAGFLSLIIPGLGQIYCGEGNKGAAILIAAIIVGNLNIIFLPVFVAANPNSEIVWAYWIPRIGHDVMSVWSVVFWIWAVVDAYSLAKKS